LTILEKIAKLDPLIEKRMNACGNGKYTSHQIQNEVLEMVQSEIMSEVKESYVFSVIADETKDLKKK
jgi:galactitol-specific phosphotransferase system IIB component